MTHDRITFLVQDVRRRYHEEKHHSGMCALMMQVFLPAESMTQDSRKNAVDIWDYAIRNGFVDC